jgi:hypothetical protein
MASPAAQRRSDRANSGISSNNKEMEEQTEHMDAKEHKHDGWMERRLLESAKRYHQPPLPRALLPETAL